MQKRHKDLLRTLVTELRHTLLGWYDDASQLQRGDLDRELERLGIAPDGRITPLDALPNPTPAERRARAVAEAQLADLPQAERPAVRSEIFERAAYSWINRLLALRAMEARGLIEETLRPNPAYDGLSEALFILRHTTPQRATGADGGWWAVIEDACRAQAASLPGLFDWNDPNTALRPSTPGLLKCITLVGGPLPVRSDDISRPPLDLVFQDPDAIGWAYQFYQEEAKARTYAKLGRGGKVETRAEIAAVTQLFTEPYMVQWLLQNSLGRSYHEIYPDSRLPETWAYYIRRSEEQAVGHPSPFTSLSDLTFMDPCAGSGHFEREAFDMLAAMYREQHPEMDARAIADRVLGEHLHGIDIDPRATQLAALTLYLRARELVRDERRRLGLPGPGDYRPSRLNLATTPTHLDPGALTRHLQRHPEDRPFEPLLRGVFEALEQAPILGSLLKPGEHLDQAIRAFRKQSAGGQYGLLDEHGDLNRLLDELGRHDPEALKRLLLERIARSFAAEAGDTDDVGAALFGREASEGVRLLQLLDNKYAVVATNPPYMGSRTTSGTLREYLEERFLAGKRDVYAAFIMQSLALCNGSGLVALVTPHNWMFLGSFESLRRKLVEEAGLSSIAHLGTKTFKDLSNTNALGFVLFVAQAVRPSAPMLTCLRLVDADDKESALREVSHGFNQDTRESSAQVYRVPLTLFEHITGTALFYWAPKGIVEAFLTSHTLSSFAEAKQGLITGDNLRFLRSWWEVSETSRWKPYVKGGQYRRWFGNQELVVDWDHEGIRVRELTTPAGRQKSRPQNVHFYFVEGGTWTGQSSYGFSVRYLPSGSIFDAKGPAFFVKPSEIDLPSVIALANTRVIQFSFSGMEPTIDYHEGYFMSLPAPSESSWSRVLSPLGSLAIELKRSAIAQIATERTFDLMSFSQASSSQLAEYQSGSLAVDAIVHLLEGSIETTIHKAYHLSQRDSEVIVSETGTPAGWYPLIAKYHAIPTLPTDLNLPAWPEKVLDFSDVHEHVTFERDDLARIKANLRTLYEAGPGAKTDDADLENMEHQGDEDEIVSGAYIPIPTETFLEELSVKLHIHPISVYWLLEELRAEGVRCKPEERQLLEDRLSVLVLRLLGHRWSRQIEAGEPVPPWADRDGIIPLTPGAGEPTVAERLRERLRAEHGPLGAQRVEALLEELTGQPLETWLRRTFFDRHTKQFKRRPIAWHLLSTPGAQGKKRSQQAPAFECLVYYHACGGDVLARIRTQYVEPLVFQARRTVDAARRSGDETAAALATARIHELEDFAGRLRQVEENGFACAALDALLAEEPLDRWSGDGVFAPLNRDELLSNERAWRVDINDGVRVNVAPLQKAGLLAGDVLNKKDLDKAIADRARWRSDERRWVRAGKLPRCGWMDESVPESPAWTDLAPAREAERVRLEEKRKTALDHTSAANNSQ